MALRTVPAIIALVLMAAHFLRAGQMELVVLCIVTPSFLLIKKRWALVLVRGVVYLGVLVWLRTAYLLVQQRWEMGAPWMRMLAILAGVAVFTAVAAHLLGSEKASKSYH